VILETRSFNLARRGQPNAFLQKDQIVICSYQFAAVKAAEVRSVPWDLVVIDEAHRLRNIYKGSNSHGNGHRGSHATHQRSCSPLPRFRTSLMELYGLVKAIKPPVHPVEPLLYLVDPSVHPGQQAISGFQIHTHTVTLF
jgi:Rad3-related DNA helicase